MVEKNPDVEIHFSIARPDEAEEVAFLRNEVAEHLTQKYGLGQWSHLVSEKTVRLGISHTSRVLTARIGGELAATLRLAQKKPWSIDPSRFSPARRPLYLMDMAVKPAYQRSGVGRKTIGEAISLSSAWPADTLRLDAYDADAGAGDFYRKCGFTEVGRVVYRKTPLIYFERLLP